MRAPGASQPDPLETGRKPSKSAHRQSGAGQRKQGSMRKEEAPATRGEWRVSLKQGLDTKVEEREREGQCRRLWSGEHPMNSRVGLL